jgi:tRNA(fMet)-specific endonuclease VapC
VITYYEMWLETVGRKASPKLAHSLTAFFQRLDSVLPWAREAADEATRIHAELGRSGKVIGPNDLMIAGHALATDCILVTNNSREFQRVKQLTIEDWTESRR